MIDAEQLQQQTSKILVGKKVLAVGVFDAGLNFGNRTLAPAAAGVATYIGTKQLMQNEDGSPKKGANAAAAVAGVAGVLGTKHLAAAHSARKKGLERVMVCAISPNRIYLLDWKGEGTGPTRKLMEFTRAHSKIRVGKRGMVHHVIDIKEDGKHARIECNLGITQSNKQINKEVLKLLKESSRQ